VTLEVLEKDNYYHIYNKGINGTAIFLDDENKSFFLRQLDKYLSETISIFAYCLMDNHFHFVIKINAEGKRVTQGFSNFFNSYVKAFNKQNARTGSLFEKHFKRIRLENEEYLRNLIIIIYIHLNPKHHLELNFETYRFSSYRTILSDKPTKIKRNEIIGLFEDIENFIFCHKQKKDLLIQKYTLE
jgi:hypothetical protein